MRAGRPESAVEGGPTIDLIYIGGMGRSGTTLLEGLLASIPGSVSVGEMKYLWSKGVERDHLCACGHAFSRCDFWQTVLHDALGGENPTKQAARVRSLRRQVESPRMLPALLWPGLRTPAFTTSLEEYKAIFSSLYTSVCRVSGHTRVLDSSKEPTYAFVLSETESLDLRLVHLIRDSRGVAFSWRRTTVKPDVHQRQTLMPKKSLMRSSMGWDYHHGSLDILSKRVVSFQLRYEDLVSDLPSHMDALAYWVGVESASDGPRRYDTVAFRDQHAIGGNPIRFAPQDVPVTFDREWMRSMRGRDKLVVTALTAPLLRRHGYQVRLGAH